MVETDYGYVKDEKDKSAKPTKILIKYGDMPLLVTKARSPKYITATLVPKKGSDPYSIRSLARDIEKLIGVLENNTEKRPRSGDKRFEKCI